MTSRARKTRYVHEERNKHVCPRLTLLNSCELCSQIKEQVITDVRNQIGSFVCLKSVTVVSALPKTRSGKVMRATIQAIADSKKYRVPATIENEAVLIDIRAALQQVGYAEECHLTM